ncbi:MAG: amidohydrolase family protein [Thermonemataceae bacterium]
MEHISRREAIKRLSVMGVATSLQPSLLASNPADDYKIVIQNGSVFTKGSLRSVNVGITQKNRIVLSKEAITGKQIIDATGKVVSPGFIDILADNASNPKQTYLTFEKYKLGDGLTTVLQMHGCMADTQGWHQYFGARPHYVNYGGGVFVMLVRFQQNTLAGRFRQVEKCLDEGALGVCHSIEYQPTPYSEMLGYAKLACKYNRPLSLHLRYSAENTELKGVQEAIQLAKDTGVRVHIAHLHSTGGTYHMAEALAMIERAREEKLDITACVYPYSYWATYLASKRFDPGWQERFKITYKDLAVVGTGEKLTEASFRRYRTRQGLLVAVPPGTMPLDKTVDLALKTDFCMVASDGGIEKEPVANNHPRGAGCFATFIQHGQKIGLTMAQILTKITTLPSNLMRPALNDRGSIATGNKADITIFDPKEIDAVATVANPNQFSKGIEAVILNGEVVYKDKKLLAKRGRLIRY